MLSRSPIYFTIMVLSWGQWSWNPQVTWVHWGRVFHMTCQVAYNMFSIQWVRYMVFCTAFLGFNCNVYFPLKPSFQNGSTFGMAWSFMIFMFIIMRFLFLPLTFLIKNIVSLYRKHQYVTYTWITTYAYRQYYFRHHKMHWPFIYQMSIGVTTVVYCLNTETKGLRLSSCNSLKSNAKVKNKSSTDLKCL